MVTDIATIATSVNHEYCDFMRYQHIAIYAKNWGMEHLNGEWIKSRLSGKRGEKAALARAMNIDPDKLSRILNGTRDVQVEEVGPLLRFFSSGSEEEKAALARLTELYLNSHPSLRPQILQTAETVGIASQALRSSQSDTEYRNDKGTK